MDDAERTGKTVLFATEAPRMRRLHIGGRYCLKGPFSDIAISLDKPHCDTYLPSEFEQYPRISPVRQEGMT